MKQKEIRLSQQYATALARHLKQGSDVSLRPALRLGSQAVALGLETLELARMHEQALTLLGLTHIKSTLAKLAGNFFSRANTLIEETHHAARQGKAQVGRLTAALSRRTEALAISNRKLQRDVVRRKATADAHEKSGEDHDKSLEESRRLQKRLRQLTHQVITAHEHERIKISHELRDEIAQALLSINVRLLNLKQAARGDTNGLKHEIASTQRLVVSSARAVRRFARELELYHPA